MTQPSVYILEKNTAAGQQMLEQLAQIDIPAQWIPTVADLLSESETRAPVVCLIGLRPPVNRVLSLVADLIQEPRFSQTAFILIGPVQHKQAAFAAGADDYVVTPPDVIELRKRVRLYLDRAALEARLVAETSITQEMDALNGPDAPGDHAAEGADPVTLLEHAAVLQQERNLFEQILLHAGSAIAMVAPDGTLRYANPGWERLFALAPTNNTLAFGWPPITTDSATNRAIAAAIEAAREWHGEACFRLPDEQRIDLALTITPAFNAAGTLDGFVLEQHDVAEQKAAINRKNRFISDAAAEMRTPVTNIKMRQYLLREVPPDQREVHLNALERETNRLAHMVEAILALSRMDAQQVQMQFEPVSLYRLASEAIIRYGPTANEHGITLTLTGGEHLPPINVDQSHITRAVGALLTNAIQHTPQTGQITIQIRSATRAEQPYQTLVVRDTGSGVAKEDIPQIFNRFYRSDRTRMKGIRGVGLGLSIAQEIVNRHQGMLTVESTVDQGSTFTVWLPERDV